MADGYGMNDEPTYQDINLRASLSLDIEFSTDPSSPYSCEGPADAVSQMRELFMEHLTEGVVRNAHEVFKSIDVQSPVPISPMAARAIRETCFHELELLSAAENDGSDWDYSTDANDLRIKLETMANTIGWMLGQNEIGNVEGEAADLLSDHNVQEADDAQD